ncbi:hypothetical protein, partial [Burkholderia ubonensis]|uniref:hypothetical protein n=1 Tax=Burkholderia ubonensis TaxID=101571 RepID=UPI001E5C86D2
VRGLVWKPSHDNRGVLAYLMPAVSRNVREEVQEIALGVHETNTPDSASNYVRRNTLPLR